MRYKIACLLLITSILSLASCKWGNDKSYSSSMEQMEDTSFTLERDLNNTLYSIPSPHQVSLLLKDDCKFFDETLLSTKIDVSQYLTSEKKALILGALGADLGYLSLYDQKNTTFKYLDYVQRLIKCSEFCTYNPGATFKNLKNNLDHSDSIISEISEVYRQENDAARNGDRPQLSALVIAGGWIESFYLLNQIYIKTQNSNLFAIILQQQIVLENLIDLLKPYYKKSNELAEIIDKLVSIAYEFEIVDVNFKNIPAINHDSLTIIKCTYIPVLSGSHLGRINEMSDSLRKSVIF